MWIRTQNKERLVKAYQIELLTYEDNNGSLKYEIICVMENDYELLLGKYSTKEKALKVLDEMTKGINLGYADLVFHQNHNLYHLIT